MVFSKVVKALLPLILFVVIAFFLLKGLGRDPHKVPSTLIGQSMPALMRLKPSLFDGHVTLVNVFASWCLYCRSEHPILMDIAQSKKLKMIGLKMIGLDYKDQPQKAREFLKKYGNPYWKVIDDPQGKIAINLGVYGTPETFVVDKQGIIRYKQVGPVSPSDWKDKLQPLVQQLNEEF